MDSQGGYLGTVESVTDLESAAPICYIAADKTCYLLAESGADFLQKAPFWKTCLQPCESIRICASQEEARKELQFLEIGEKKCFEKEL